MGKLLFLYFIILSSLRFFDIWFISETGKLYLELLAVVFIMLIILKKPTLSMKSTFSGQLFWIIVFLFFSAIGALYLNEQSLIRSFITQRIFYFYLFFFALKTLNLPIKYVYYLLIAIAITYSFFYVTQYFLYPKVEILSAKMTEDRTKVRIYLQGIIYLVLSSTYCLILFQNTKNYKYLLFVIFGLGVIILQSTRIIIVAFIVIIIIAMTKGKINRLFKYLPALIVLFLVIGYSITYYEPDFYENLLLSTSKDLDKGENYIRLQEVIYFFADMLTKPLSFFLGNGVPSSFSNYGIQKDFEKDFLNFHLSDIGIVGDYYQLGLTYIFFLILLLRKVNQCLKTHKNDLNVTFVKYGFLFTLLTLPTISFFSRVEGIIPISILLYILDKTQLQINGQKLLQAS